VIESIDRQEGKLRKFEVTGSGTISEEAKVRQEIDYANQVAREMGLDFRIRLV